VGSRVPSTVETRALEDPEVRAPESAGLVKGDRERRRRTRSDTAGKGTAFEGPPVDFLAVFLVVLAMIGAEGGDRWGPEATEIRRSGGVTDRWNQRGLGKKNKPRT